MSTDKPTGTARRYVLAALPLVLFLSMAFIFYKQLISGIDPNKLPSVLIGKPAPAFPGEILQGLKKDGVQIPAISDEIIAGKVALVNVWASWCVPCRVEHPVLSKFAKENKDVPLVGINYKDKNPNALRFLGALGNPYAAVSIDPTGAASIDWGVYGIPETFIVDKTGVIIHKHVGPISQKVLETKLIPIINAAKAK